MGKLMRGFTLIELMIVIAIGGILWAVLFPAFQELLAEQEAQEAAQRLKAEEEKRRAAGVTCIDGYLFTTTGAPVYGDDGFAKSCD